LQYSVFPVVNPRLPRPEVQNVHTFLPWRLIQGQRGPTANHIDGDWQILFKTLPTASVYCCVTSPVYVEALRVVFAAARRVLRDNGTLWPNGYIPLRESGSLQGGIVEAGCDTRFKLAK